MTLDPTIHIADVITTIITVILIPIFKLLVSTLIELRDSVRELNFKMGSNEPPLGVLGAVAKLESKVEEHSRTLIQYRDWLIKIQDRRKKDDNTG
jgi:hypothetical protein